ncbi:MAG: alpha/beta fold hydrolase [Anaerolineae bacterium]|nr:alpha/beta fold hydrolase [Anaerolineae bacterium]
MSIVIIEGRMVHYEAIGRGRPVVFIHGWLGSWRYWMSAMDDLSERYRAYALDLWGFGDTERRQDGYSLSAYVDLVEQFMEELGIAQAVLVGHDLGGVVAIRLAARAPERVDRLVAVSTPLVGSAIAPSLANFSNHHNGEWLSRILGRRQASAYPEVQMEASKTDLTALIRSIQTVCTEDLRPELESFPFPVLLVYGKNDPLIRPPEDHWVNQWEENIYLVSLEDSSHFPMLDEATRFSRLLRQFLALGTGVEALELRDEWRRRTR